MVARRREDKRVKGSVNTVATHMMLFSNSTVDWTRRINESSWRKNGWRWGEPAPRTFEYCSQKLAACCWTKHRKKTFATIGEPPAYLCWLPQPPSMHSVRHSSSGNPMLDTRVPRERMKSMCYRMVYVCHLPVLQLDRISTWVQNTYAIVPRIFHLTTPIVDLGRRREKHNTPIESRFSFALTTHIKILWNLITNTGNQRVVLFGIHRACNRH